MLHDPFVVSNTPGSSKHWWSNAATRSVANVSHHGMLVKHEDEVIGLVDAFSIG